MTSIAAQLRVIEALLEQAASGNRAALERAVVLWELCTRDDVQLADVLRIEATLRALGVEPAKEKTMNQAPTCTRARRR